MWGMMLCLWALIACACAAGNCRVVGDDGTTYKEEVLASELDFLRGLAVDWSTDVLYFNYLNETLYKRVSVSLDLKTKMSSIIEELTESCNFAVDQLRGDVYAGCWSKNGGGGLYQRDSNVGRFVLVGAERQNVTFVHYADEVLYYTADPRYQLHTYKDGQTHVVPAFEDSRIYQLVVDGYGDWVYHNDLGIYRRSPTTGEVVVYSRGIKMDKPTASPSGDVYVCDYYGNTMYLVDYDKLRRVVFARNCHELAFDSLGNVIYVNWVFRGIVRLIKC